MNSLNRLNIHRHAVIAAAIVLSVGVVGTLMLARPAEASVSAIGTMATCNATWYGAVGEIPEGWPTASGEPFHRMALKAAHNSLPFGTRVKVTYQGKSVTVTINDRGGFGGAVCLDLTYGAFTQIANTDLGNIVVQYQVL
ncbi:septal ring lytic transglycosylase RlpA family protein [Stigmatella aurantiaca]|uniref:septal ring lytic transglycosylase RlpA family protein n=1 Tax=Stigmatella aurantiaca TaxID=41 RepID=UPI000319AF92|nr:septal ring lytic transglycosylase RlpA family protein [Stigmatella aurantiaca]